MDTLPIHDFAQACRLFMETAYPDGTHTIPDSKRPYCEITADCAITDYFPPAPRAAGICQDLSKVKGGVPGYEFRLGSATHPHLKLRVQRMDFHGREVWVYSVDTHDRFLQATQHLCAEETDAWRLLVEQNRVLKHRIEESLAQAGYMTPISLLRLDLTSPTA